MVVSSLMGWIKFLVDVGGAEALVSKYVYMSSLSGAFTLFTSASAV